MRLSGACEREDTAAQYKCWTSAASQTSYNDCQSLPKRKILEDYCSWCYNVTIPTYDPPYCPLCPPQNRLKVVIVFLGGGWSSDSPGLSEIAFSGHWLPHAFPRSACLPVLAVGQMFCWLWTFPNLLGGDLFFLPLPCFLCLRQPTPVAHLLLFTNWEEGCLGSFIVRYGDMWVWLLECQPEGLSKVYEHSCIKPCP